MNLGDQKQHGKSGFPFIAFIFLAVIGYFGYQFFTKQSGSAFTGSADNLASDSDGLYILAGSELKDLEPFIPDIKKATGIQIGFEYTGTLDGVDAIVGGKQVDAAWFSHGKYLSLTDQSKIKSQSQIMLSPVVMGIKQSKAQAFGWVDASGKQLDVTWQDIADKSASGELSFAMTNPSSSNSGFTALMGVVAALSGTSDAPQQEDVDKAKPKLKAFFQGQSLTSGSSGWLAEQYVREQNRLDAMINYESVLMQLNDSGQLADPLMLLYPKEGIVTADYPIMLMNAEKKPAFEKLVAYLKSPEFQQKVMTQTQRRPVNRQVQLDSRFKGGANNLLVELPFPNNNKVVDGILMSYLDEIRVPANVVFVIDTSGSMRGAGMEQLKNAMLSLTNPDATGSSRFARFSEREHISMLPFSNHPYDPTHFEITKDSSEQMELLNEYVYQLNAQGSTAIYESLETAYNMLAQQKEQNEKVGKKRSYSIVLMTDGDNSAGPSLGHFEAFYKKQPGLRNVKTFTVLFGSADEAEMQRVAELTGGRMFDGRKGDLSRVFKKIRGYQ